MKKLLLILGISSAIIACNSGGEQAETTNEAAPDTMGVPSAALNERGLELIGASDCTTCHAIDKKLIGPAYTDVAAKYENTPAVVDTLVSKIINGGAGNWGPVAMTPHAELPEADAREMVNYILSLKNR